MLSIPQRSFLALVLACCPIGRVPADVGSPNQAIQVQEVDNLQADGVLAKHKRTPLLIAFFSSYCEWCDRMELEILRPLLLSGDYGDKIIIRKVTIDGYATFIGFDGNKIAADRLAFQYDASFTPTLIFVDHRGRELTERMVGLTTPEMYGGYLDETIDQAQARYRKATANE